MRTRDCWQRLARQTNDPAIGSGYRNFLDVKSNGKFDSRKGNVFRGMSSKLLDFLKLSLLGNDINPAQSVTDVRVIFDPTLSFDSHISTVVSSCMSKLSQISRIRFVFDEPLLETIINALVFSKLYYCSSVWSSASVCDISKLHYVQNLAARIRSAT